jgi:hypothetical protein
VLLEMVTLWSTSDASRAHFDKLETQNKSPEELNFVGALTIMEKKKGL